MEEQGKYGKAWIEGFTKAAMANGANAEETKALLKVAAILEQLREPDFVEGLSKQAEAMGVDVDIILDNILVKEAAKWNFNPFEALGKFFRWSGQKSVDAAKGLGDIPESPFLRGLKGQEWQDAARAKRDAKAVGQAAADAGGQAADASSGAARAADAAGAADAGKKPLFNKGPRGPELTIPLGSVGNALWNPITVGGAILAGSAVKPWIERNVGRDEYGRQYYDLMRLANEGKIPHEVATQMLRDTMGNRARGHLSTLGFNSGGRRRTPYDEWFSSDKD